MEESGVRGGICNAICQYVKGNDKYMKGYDKNKESSYPKFWIMNNIYVYVMSQKVSVGGFNWIENKPKYSEGFIKNYNYKRKHNRT